MEFEKVAKAREAVEKAYALVKVLQDVMFLLGTILMYLANKFAVL